MYRLNLIVNGKPYITEIKADATLLEVLRDKLQVTSPKVGCNTGDCGACSVIVDGKLRRACITLALTVEGKAVLTVEGLGRPGHLHPVQEAFQEYYASQCGFCTPGMVMAAVALLGENPQPTREEVREYLSGNLCRCTGYQKIIDAVMAAAGKLAQKTEEMKA